MAKGKKKRSLSAEELVEQALVPEDGQPYEVPRNWCWVKFNNLKESETSFFDGDWILSENMDPNGNVRLIQLSDIGIGEFLDKSAKFISDHTFNELDCSQLCEDDVLISRMAEPIARSCILPKLPMKCITAVDVAVMRCNSTMVLNKYVNYLCNASWFTDLANNLARGTTRVRITRKNLGDMPFPLPPLAEQQRIVDHIESMFAKLDHTKELAQSALDSFETRKAAILHKAFTGELTAKWREEHNIEPAENRFAKVVKTRLEFDSRSKNLITYLNELNIDEVTDSNGWIHLKAMLLCDNITCGGTPTGFIYEYGDIPFLKVYNIIDNKIAFAEKPQFTNRETHDGKLKSSKLKPNDVVMNIVGPPLRKIAVIPDDYSEWNMNQAIVRFRTTKHVLPKFLYYCLVNPATLDEVISDTKGVVGQANISITQSRNLNIPVPAVEEQNEIVRILDSFFDKEQKAKEHSDVIDKIDNIKKAILARAFRGELGTNDPIEKSSLESLRDVLSNA